MRIRQSKNNWYVSGTITVFQNTYIEFKFLSGPAINEILLPDPKETGAWCRLHHHCLQFCLACERWSKSSQWISWLLLRKTNKHKLYQHRPQTVKTIPVRKSSLKNCSFAIWKSTFGTSSRLLYFEGILVYFGSILLYFESILLYFESVLRKYTFVLRKYTFVLRKYILLL